MGSGSGALSPAYAKSVVHIKHEQFYYFIIERYFGFRNAPYTDATEYSTHMHFTTYETHAHALYGS